mmetsp:Transcript_11639/g.45260  ORF Transcript_11639/g.45260 Transcript_11639/m.45260 type:complete len:89 (+) Transcript_11639:539-805(+)
MLGPCIVSHSRPRGHLAASLSLRPDQVGYSCGERTGCGKLAAVSLSRPEVQSFRHGTASNGKRSQQSHSRVKGSFQTAIFILMDLSGL